MVVTMQCSCHKEAGDGLFVGLMCVVFRETTVRLMSPPLGLRVWTATTVTLYVCLWG